MNATDQMLEYLDPTIARTDKALLVPNIGQLKGKRIAFVNNGWTCFTKMGVDIGRELRDRFGVTAVKEFAIPPSAAPAPGLLAAIAADCNGAIVGLAN